jgi:hypothetical protein
LLPTGFWNRVASGLAVPVAEICSCAAVGEHSRAVGRGTRASVQ